ncbi:hypothetical protein QJQ45_026499, partial [Haematococcus lacustris]
RTFAEVHRSFRECIVVGYIRGQDPCFDPLDTQKEERDLKMSKVVISEPAKELAGKGEKNAKYIRECTELYLGNKGIEKLRGFEPFVSLESLWLNNNKLKKLNNLDANIRIKTLYAHNNQICTLKGSLACLHFLDTLDLSNNQLRDLDKLVAQLGKLKFLKTLNLKGNPCCEEPDYRMLLVHRLPSLEVLDQHAVSDTERRRAQELLGGDGTAAKVAFLQHLPPDDGAWRVKVAQPSALEQQLVKEAANIRETQRVKRLEDETALFSHNPHPDIPRGRSLPPNSGTRRAQDLHAAAAGGQPAPADRARGGMAQRSYSANPSLTLAFKDAFSSQPPPRLPSALQPLPTSGLPFLPAGQGGGQGLGALGDSWRLDSLAARTQSTLSGKGLGPLNFGTITGTTRSAMSLPNSPGLCRGGGPEAAQQGEGQYQPRDQLAIYSCRPGNSPLAAGLAHLHHVGPYLRGSIRFDEKGYREWVQLRSCGQEPWQLAKTQVNV